MDRFNAEEQLMERPEKKDLPIGEKLASALFEDRILFLGHVTMESAMLLNMQLLYLESRNAKQDIFLFINSPGGSVAAGFSIFDTMNFVQCDIWTVCLGTAASMGAFILAGGARGKRICLPNSTVMIHQPLQQFGVSVFQATELQIAAREIMRTRDRLNNILAHNTGQSIEQINQDTERDFWMVAEEALEYGLVDLIATSRDDISLLVKKLKNREVRG
jgi:ATP-dependent Clp protease, protease subunit